MKQIIISVAGALLILKVIKTILPEGTVKKYASFIVSCMVMLILVMSVTPWNNLELLLPEDGEVTINPQNLRQIQREQIEREFSRQLREDMKKSIPELSTAELSFTFNIDEDNMGYVTHMFIESPLDENENVILRISELYRIDKNVISWRKI